MLEGIHRLIDAVESQPAIFPPTLLYNGEAVFNRTIIFV